MDDCDCVGPGPVWCDRHKVLKSSHWVHLCQTNEKYRTAWDEGRGPGQLKPSGESPIQPPDLSFPTEREAACTICNHFKGVRCDVMDLGCRSTFLRVARTSSSKCPLGRW